MENTCSITDERKEQENFFQLNIYETKRSASGRILGNIDKKVKNSAKADRNAYTEEQAIKAEKKPQTIYKITKTLAGKFQLSDFSVRDKTGNVLSKVEVLNDEKIILKRCLL